MKREKSKSKVKTNWMTNKSFGSFKARDFLILSALLIFSFVATSSLAQQKADDSQSLSDGDEVDHLSKDAVDKSFNKEIKYISLFVGIESQEKIPNLPEDAEFSGDYKKVTKVGVDRASGLLRFTPNKLGVATLTVRQGNKVIREYRLDVKKSDLTKVAKDIQSLLKDIDGITIKIVNNRVVVDGQVLLPKEINRIHSVLKQFEGQASTLVTLSPLAERKIAQIMEEAIGITTVHVRTVNGKFILDGEVESADKKDMAMTIAQTYIPDLVPLEAQKDGLTMAPKTVPVINLITIKAAPEKPAAKIIQLVVHFVELKKEYAKDFGFSWAPGFADSSGIGFSMSNSAAGGTASTISGTVSNLIPRLNWSKSHSHSRVLESTEILIQDGSKGILNRITGYPYTQQGPNQTTTTAYKDVGLKVNITPKLANARSDNINLNLDFEMSEVVSIGVGGAPNVATNTVSTVISIRSGQSAAVAGLVSNKTGTAYNRAPAGGAVNPIFNLSASKAFQHDQSQFVVFVTPIIKSSASQGAEKIKQKFRLRD